MIGRFLAAGLAGSVAFVPPAQAAAARRAPVHPAAKAAAGIASIPLLPRLTLSAPGPSSPGTPAVPLTAAPSVSRAPAAAPRALATTGAARAGALPRAASAAPAGRASRRAPVMKAVRGLESSVRGASRGSALSLNLFYDRGGASRVGSVAAQRSPRAVRGTDALPRVAALRSGARARRLRLKAPAAAAPRPGLAALLKAYAFRAVTTAQRLWKRKPKARISDATPTDLDAITEIMQAAREAQNAAAGAANESGFYIGSYTRQDYLRFINDPATHVLVARDRKGRVSGFAIYYGRVHIRKDAAERQELNRVALDAVSKKYGSEEELLIVKQVAIHPKAKRSGIGPQIVNEVIYRMLKSGHSFIGGTIVNDAPLVGTALDVPGAKLLTNNASRRMADAVKGKLLLTGFVYSHELSAYLADPERYLAAHPAGIHAFELRMRSLSPRRRPIPDVSLPQKNKPPARVGYALRSLILVSGTLGWAGAMAALGASPAIAFGAWLAALPAVIWLWRLYERADSRGRSLPLTQPARKNSEAQE